MNVVWFNGWSDIVRTVLAGTVTYIALILLLRFTGPRTLAKWYAFDLIVTVALGSTFANGVLSKDISIAQALTGFVLLVALQYVIGKVAIRYPRVVRYVNPAPVLVLVKGRLLEDAMAENRVTKADICKALRGKGWQALEDAGAVVLEPDGTFSVVERIEGPDTSALDDVPGFVEALRGGGRSKREGSDKGAMA